MNWEAIGAAGEVFGALVVVATLVYLSRQISEQVKAATTENMSSWLSDYNSLVLRLTDSGETADIIRRGLADFDSLGGKDKTRFHMWIVTHTLTAQNLFLQQKSEFMNEHITEMVLAVNASVIKTNGGAQWWAYTKPTVEPSFAAEMERRIEEGPSVADLFPWIVMAENENEGTPNK